MDIPTGRHFTDSHVHPEYRFYQSTPETFVVERVAKKPESSKFNADKLQRLKLFPIFASLLRKSIVSGAEKRDRPPPQPRIFFWFDYISKITSILFEVTSSTASSRFTFAKRQKIRRRKNDGNALKQYSLTNA